MPDYNAAVNPHYLGRGKVHFTVPLAPDGAVNPTAFGARWGDNWTDVSPPVGNLIPRPGRFVGNAAGMEILPRTDRANVCGWDARGDVIIQGADLSLTLYGHGAENLATALLGVREESGSEPVTDHVATGRAAIDAGGMLFTRALVDQQWPVTVTPSWTTWTEGEHWQAETFGVRVLQGFSAPPGSSIAIAYTPEGGAETVQALANTGIELGVVFAGTNKADGAPVQVEVFRAAPVLDSGLKPIADGASSVGLKFAIKPVWIAGSNHWYRVTRSIRATEV